MQIKTRDTDNYQTKGENIVVNMSEPPPNLNPSNFAANPIHLEAPNNNSNTIPDPTYNQKNIANDEKIQSQNRLQDNQNMSTKKNHFTSLQSRNLETNVYVEPQSITASNVPMNEVQYGVNNNIEYDEEKTDEDDDDGRGDTSDDDEDIGIGDDEADDSDEDIETPQTNHIVEQYNAPTNVHTPKIRISGSKRKRKEDTPQNTIQEALGGSNTTSIDKIGKKKGRKKQKYTLATAAIAVLRENGGFMKPSEICTPEFVNRFGLKVKLNNRNTTPDASLRTALHKHIKSLGSMSDVELINGKFRYVQMQDHQEPNTEKIDDNDDVYRTPKRRQQKPNHYDLFQQFQQRCQDELQDEQEMKHTKNNSDQESEAITLQQQSQREGNGIIRLEKQKHRGLMSEQHSQLQSTNQHHAESDDEDSSEMEQTDKNVHNVRERLYTDAANKENQGFKIAGNVTMDEARDIFETLNKFHSKDVDSSVPSTTTASQLHSLMRNQWNEEGEEETQGGKKYLDFKSPNGQNSASLLQNGKNKHPYNVIVTDDIDDESNENNMYDRGNQEMIQKNQISESDAGIKRMSSSNAFARVKPSYLKARKNQESNRTAASSNERVKDFCLKTWISHALNNVDENTIQKYCHAFVLSEMDAPLHVLEAIFKESAEEAFKWVEKHLDPSLRPISLPRRKKIISAIMIPTHLKHHHHSFSLKDWMRSTLGPHCNSKTIDQYVRAFTSSEYDTPSAISNMTDEDLQFIEKFLSQISDEGSMPLPRRVKIKLASRNIPTHNH